MKYAAELSSLSSYVHGRNARLLKIALLGRHEGFSPERIAADLIDAGGAPRLTDAEVNRAVAKAFNATPLAAAPRGLSKGAKRATPPRINEKAQGFVREMIAAGGGEGSSARLKALSPIPVVDDEIFDSFNLLDELLPESDAELYFAGTPYTRRTRAALKTKKELVETISTIDPPTHFIPNPFTGESALNERGEESFCLEKTLAAKRLALIEFDELPLKAQAAFWEGAIRERLLPVASLVYSGGKSIHGLLRLKPNDWEGQWRTLEKLLASDPERTYRCDIACKNPGRMTRFPWAKRPETGRFQKVLYIG